MAASHIPPELFEEVFSLLANEPATLQACALVHRSWTRGSQCQLFRAVDIESASEWTRLRSLLEDSHHIRPMLRRLVLRCPVALARPRPSLFPRVTSLAYFVNWERFETAVLDNFPALCALETGQVMEVIENAQGPDLGALRCLESLALRGWPTETMLHWVRRNDCSQTLREFEVAVPSAVVWGSNTHRKVLLLLRSVLQSLSGLRKLQLNVQFWDPDADVAFGQIRTPRLIVHFPPDERVLPVLMTILKQTTFVGLRRLEVLIDSDFPRYCETLRDVSSDDNGPAFDPFKLVLSENTVPLKYGSLIMIPALTGQLEEIVISLPGIHTLYQASRFLAIFGEANRPGVLHFLPSTIILRDDALP